MSNTLEGKAGEFLALHHSEHPLLQPNAWDLGSAKVLASLGFKALATTSSGFAMTLGRIDGDITREEALGHSAQLANGIAIPIAADFEDAFAVDPAGVAESITLACQTGLAGCSIEDFTRDMDDPIFELRRAVDRVRAAAEAAHGGPQQLVLTARAENHIRGRTDLADTIARLQAFQEAGADVLFAPGLRQADQVRSILAEIDRPLNVLVAPGLPSIAELGEMGVARISIGGCFAYTAMAGTIAAAVELRDEGTYGFWDVFTPVRDQIRDALLG